MNKCLEAFKEKYKLFHITEPDFSREVVKEAYAWFEHGYYTARTEAEIFYEGSNVQSLLDKAKAEGVEDPEVSCEVHGFSSTYNQLSETAKMCLHAGLDSATELKCLLEG